MRLIADAGGSKTDWRLLGEFNIIHQAKTDGLNPYFLSEAEIEGILRSDPLQMFPAEEIEEIVFYGAGCSGERQITRMENVLAKVYPHAEICVEHDLLGAARAVCGKNPGIAAILGTGSNTALYDGTHITQNIPSLGYVLGDEGAGADLGKAVCSAFCRDEMPQHLSDAFRSMFGHNKDSILQNVYSEPFPNRFLAHFTRFLSRHMDDPWVRELLTNRFNAFFSQTVLKYPGHADLTVGFVGSIAYHFSRILTDVAQANGIHMGTILETPIAALTLYHLNEYE